MSEWRLFPAGTVPEYTTVEFFQNHPWVPPGHQRGHSQRIQMVADLIADLHAKDPVSSVTDLGAGDGSLLTHLWDLGVPMWGYDAGAENVERARVNGVDVRSADLLSDEMEYGDLVAASEVVEHLLDPHDFVRNLPGKRIVLSSPSAENEFWHYEHHAWAWDMDGYKAMVEQAGWTVVEHRECDAERNFHCGMWQNQRFQAIAAVR